MALGTTFPTRVGSSAIGTGRGTGPTGLGLFYQYQIDAPAGDLGRRRRGLEAEGYAPCALVAGA